MKHRTGIRLNDRQRFDWIRLSRVRGVGPRTFHGLINKFGGAASALEYLPDLSSSQGRVVIIPTIEEIEKELLIAKRLGINFLAYGEEDYPFNLINIDSPPPILTVLGDVSILDRPSIAIVGARNASAQGRKMAGKLAEDLSKEGYVVVSGLARGIDTQAHISSLEGGTIAVLAGGLDKPYPPENENLYNKIGEKGAVISEMPLGFSPRGRDFPRRNRLVSGLSLGVIVVEAARRSGSLITARLAGEQGRALFAVPGSPLDPRCEGTNDLLREGASVATSAEDILQILIPMAGKIDASPRFFREEPAPFTVNLFDESEDDSEELKVEEHKNNKIKARNKTIKSGNNNKSQQEEYSSTDKNIELENQSLDFLSFLDEDVEDIDNIEESSKAVEYLSAEEKLLSLIAIDPVEIDYLTRISGLPQRQVQQLIFDMEMTGAIRRHPGNKIALSV